MFLYIGGIPWKQTFRTTDLGVRSEVRIPPLITYLQNFQISVFLQENCQTSQYWTDMICLRALILWDTLHCWRALILCFDTMYNYYPFFRVKTYFVRWIFYTVESFFYIRASRWTNYHNIFKWHIYIGRPLYSPLLDTVGHFILRVSVYWIYFLYEITFIHEFRMCRTTL